MEDEKEIKKKRKMWAFTELLQKWYDRNTRKTRLAEMRERILLMKSNPWQKPGGMSLIIDMNRRSHR